MTFKISTIITLVAVIVGSSANEVSAQEGEWVSLFDGKTTKGWHTYGKSEAGAAWEVSDGTLHLNIDGKTQDNRGDLVTDKEYENYHLKLEWKISEGEIGRASCRERVCQYV